MPTPSSGESKKAYIKRCIPKVIEDGTAKDGKQGFAICNSMWNRRKEKSMTDQVDEKSDTMDGMVNAFYSGNETITSFSQLEDQVVAGEEVTDVARATSLLLSMISNIKYSNDVSDKEGAIKTAVSEYTSLVDDILSGKLQEKSIGFIDFLKSVFVGDGEGIDEKERAFKTEGGKKFYASDYAYVPDSSKPSTWKLRLAETPGKITVAQLGRAAAAFSSGGFRGNRVQLPSGAVAAAKRKIRAAYARLKVPADKIPESLKSIDEGEGFTLMKDANGDWRWLAIYSNNYEDDDNPPDIISEKSHLRFVDMVDKGEAEMPELRHWHILGSRWGVADMVAYDKESGVAIATGTIDKEFYNIAENMAAHPETDIRLSHGMPLSSIKRDENDPMVIIEHVTKEISDLPGWAAANRRTVFVMNTQDDSEEKAMGLPDAKKKYLLSVGYSEEQIKAIEEGNKQLKKDAVEDGVRSKEAPESGNQPVTETPKLEETPVPETKPEEKEKATQPEFLTKSEYEESVVELMRTVSDTVIEQVTKLIEANMVAMKTLIEKQSETALTPTASLGAMLSQQFRAVGNKEAATRKDSALSNDGPEETPAEKTPIVGGNPFLSSLMTDIVNGGNKNA